MADEVDLPLRYRHYRTFIQLAEQILPAYEVAKRWEQMLTAEAKIIQQQRAAARIHGGV